jgi:desampylase
VDSLTIDEGAADDIVAHARELAPLECCGLLIGDGSRVALTRRARNEEASPTCFVIDPRDHFDAIREAGRLGLAVVGAYHSHPRSAPAPSARDDEDAAGREQGFVSIIVSLRDESAPALRAFVWRDGNFRPVTLVRIR